MARHRKNSGTSQKTGNRGPASLPRKRSPKRSSESYAGHMPEKIWSNEILAKAVGCVILDEALKDKTSVLRFFSWRHILLCSKR
jgi:hypothetical protein